MTAREDIPRSGFAHDHTPLDAARAAFDWLVTGPWPLTVDGRLFAGLPARAVPLDELRELLLHADTLPAVRNAVWAHLVARTRTEPRTGRGTWTVAAVGVALPALGAIAATLGRDVAGDRSDIHAAIVAGFVTELATIDLTRPRIMKRLWWAANRAGHLALDEILDAPTPYDPDLPPPTSTSTSMSTSVSIPEPVSEAARGSLPRQRLGHPDLVLARAVADGVITTDEAHLIYTTRLEKVPLAVVAPTWNIHRKALNRVRIRAELRLRAYLRDDTPDIEPATASSTPPTTTPATTSTTPAGLDRSTSPSPSPATSAHAAAAVTETARAASATVTTEIETGTGVGIGIGVGPDSADPDTSTPTGSSPTVTELRELSSRNSGHPMSRNHRRSTVAHTRVRPVAPTPVTSRRPPLDPPQPQVRQRSQHAPQDVPGQLSELSTQPPLDSTPGALR